MSWLVTLTLALFLTIPALSFAHSGGTDAKGCHTEKKTGNYHCHTPKSAPVRPPAKAVKKSPLFVDKNCKDFRTQKEAQAFFVKEGGPLSDPHRLDADKDGKACEELK